MKRSAFTKSSGIYQIQSKINGKKYIGSGINLKERKNRHLRDLEKESHHNGHLQNHINKYGLDDLKFSILEFCMKKKLIEREQYYMDLLQPEFNINLKADSPLGIKRSEKTKQKISKIHKGRKYSKEVRKRNSEAHKGHIHTEEHKRKISESLKGKYTGKANSMYGKHLSEEHKRKISKGNKGKKMSEEAKRKCSESKKGEKNPNYGKHWEVSEETKKKLSLARKTIKNKV